MDDAATADISPNDFLSEFVNSLGAEYTTPSEVNTTVNTDNVEETLINSSSDIEEAWNRWLNSILDFESRCKKTASVRANIESSLSRSQQDGFLCHQDVSELKYIADLWLNLLDSFSTYKAGCEFVKRDIVTYLLELHKLRQINDCLFIESCLQL